MSGSFGLARHNQEVSSAAGGDGFAEDSCREQPLVFEVVRTVEHHNVQIARERKMLKAVVKQEYVDGMLLLDALAFGKAIFADAKRNPALQTMPHQLDFVARAASAMIAPAQNRDALPFREKFFREPHNHGRLAGAANGQIADADHFGRVSASASASLAHKATHASERSRQT